jgi:hypothetical protein
MSLLGRLLAAIVIWRRVVRDLSDEGTPPDGAAPPAPPLPPDVDPRVRHVAADPRAETIVAALLLACALCAVAFVALYVVDDDTQLLGLSGGLTLALLAAALLLAGRRLVPQVREVQTRPALDEREQQGELVELLRAGVDGVSRRRLLRTRFGRPPLRLLGLFERIIGTLPLAAQDEALDVWRAVRRELGRLPVPRHREGR